MVPSTVVMPREGSFALASFGRVRKVQEPTFAVAAGRKSFALKRILDRSGFGHFCLVSLGSLWEETYRTMALKVVNRAISPDQLEVHDSSFLLACRTDSFTDISAK